MYHLPRPDHAASAARPPVEQTAAIHDSAALLPRSSGGFSLVELMVVVAILALLTAVAAPPFREAVVRYHLSDMTGDLRAALTMARVEAARRAHPVYLERLSPCSSGGGDDWDCGWQLVADANGDGLTQTDEVLRVRSLASGYRVGHASLGNRVAFSRWGQAQPSAQRFTIGSVDSGMAQHDRTLCINGTGGIRILAGDVACP